MPLRVIHLINSLGQGGAERLLLDLTSYWDPARVASSVIALLRATLPIAPLEELPVHWQLLEMHTPYSPRGPSRAYRALDAAEADVLHTHLMLADFIGRRYARGRPSTKVLTTLHSPADHYLGPPKGIPSPLQYAYARMARSTPGLWVGCSAQVAQSFMEHPRWSAEVLVVENGLDPRRLALTHPREDDIRQKLGLTEGQQLIVTVARLVPSKGHEVLIDALAQLGDPRLIACWVGEGPLVAHLQRYATAHGVRDQIRLEGSRQDVTPYLRAADVFILPSIREGMPLALLEAMALGCPIITTDASGIGDVLTSARAGLVVKPGDASALASALRSLLASPELRTALGQRAARLFQDRYHVRRCATEYQDLYERMRAKG